jgi:EAL domain-containing protein (putative c-di-GMP-specific phosphodiesterase class I)
VVTTIRNVVTTLDGAQRHVTASVGAVMVDQRAESPSQLLAVADMTMYDAKEAGRDQWRLFDSEVHDRPRTGTNIEWTSRITRALAQGEFVLHLQPIRDIHADRVTGAEVLLRMVDGDTLAYPDQFLHVAERSELVNRIDELVVLRSVALLADLQQQNRDFHLEVNLSGRSIGHPGMERILRSALDEHRVDPAGLVLEITETAAVADVQTARAFAERITALGCRFALDDFGAGFGSFYYLKHLLFDYVKIDGEFVAHCHASPTDRAIVNSIVGIAHGLGKKAIAEYVSEPAILDVVRAEGVDFAQGYHIGKPVPADQFGDQYLRSSTSA